jgi:hypothetical protein
MLDIRIYWFLFICSHHVHVNDIRKSSHELMNPCQEIRDNR